MSTQGPQQAPIVVQRQHSTRTAGTPSRTASQHVRTSSTATRSSATPGRGAEAGPSSVATRDPDSVRLATGTASSSHRPGHSRQASAMSEGTTNGTSGQGAMGEDRQSSHHHNPPRPRKTTIHGATGTWVLGKTVGAGSMGKVKLAKRHDGSEQVRYKVEIVQWHSKLIRPHAGCGQNCTQASHS